MDLSRFNLHNPSVLGFSFAEGGYLYYKIAPQGIPYIFQYMVMVDWRKQIPAFIHIPLTWPAVSIDRYCLPAYISEAWEWGPRQEKPKDWRPSINYIKDKYNSLGLELYVPDQWDGAEVLSFPLSFADDFFRFRPPRQTVDYI